MLVFVLLLHQMVSLFGRSRRFGIDGVDTVLATLLTIAVLGLFLRITHIRRVHGNFKRLAIVFTVALLLFGYEVYYGIQDYLFIAKANELGSLECGVYCEPRWPPNSDVDLVYSGSTREVEIWD